MPRCIEHAAVKLLYQSRSLRMQYSICSHQTRVADRHLAYGCSFPNGREHRSNDGINVGHRLFFSTLLNLGPLPISTAKLSILHTVNDIAVPFDATAALIVTSMFKKGALNPEPRLRPSGRSSVIRQDLSST